MKRTAANERTGLLLFGAFGLLLALISVGRSGLDYLYKLNGREIVGTVLYSGLSYGANHTAQSYMTYEYVVPDGRSFDSTQTGYTLNPGERIRIEYLGTHPSVSRVAGVETREKEWVMPLGVLGLLMMALSFHALSAARNLPAQIA
ncbi:MAG: DUF3592 domain-containing protein [Candidatus Acidiferrales bacterium]